MEIQGKVIAVLAPREGTSKTGNPWKVQEYVIETEEQYPKKMCFEIFGNDRISQFASMLVVGNTVKVSFDIDAHEYQGRWYNSVRAFDVRLVDPSTMGMGAQPMAAQPVAAASQAQAPFPQQPAANAEGGDDLPF